MTWFTENPTPPVVLGTIIAAVFAVVLAKTGKREALWGVILTVVATVAVVAMNLLIVTPREEVTRALEEIRQLVEKIDRMENRTELLKRIDPSAVSLRNQVQSDLAYLTVDSAKIKDLEILVDATNQAAKAKFLGVIDFKDGAGRLPYTHFVLNFVVQLRKVDGVWVVVSAEYTPYSPAGHGHESPSPVAKIIGENVG
jgi:hypothetical protein